MANRPRPRSLRPMPKEQKIWLVATIILFVIFAMVGWSVTVGRALKKSFQASRVEISGQLNTTKDAIVGDQDLGQKTKETSQKMQSFFQNINEEITQSSTH